MRSIVVIPTYNERPNLENLVGRLLSLPRSLDILVVDDNSPDGTGEIAERLAIQYPQRVFVLHRPGKQGLGRAYVAGFKYCLARNYDLILQMDGDFSHDPAYIPAFFDAISRSDLVLGSRYVNGINVVNWDFKRLLLSKLASVYVRFITRMPVQDPTGGFKCWRRAVLESIDLSSVFSNGYVFQVEMTYRAFCLGFRIEELPIIFYERKLGRSKMDWRVIAEAIYGVVKTRLKVRRSRRQATIASASALPACRQRT